MNSVIHRTSDGHAPALALTRAGDPAHTGARRSTGVEAVRRAWPWMGLFALYALIGLRGYGTDPDTYEILRAGHGLLVDGVYRPSRFQGSLVAEAAIGAASLLGGHALSNAVSALLGTLTIVLFQNLLRERIGARAATAAAAVVAVNPWYVVASTSSMDYVYALFFMVLGLWLIRRGTGSAAAGAGLALALAVSARLSVGPVAAAILLLWLLYAASAPERRRAVGAGAVTAAAGLLLYVPAWLSAGRTLEFMRFAIGDLGPAGYAVRFAYKNVMLWGLPAALLLTAGVVGAWRGRARGAVERRWVVAGLVLMAAQELVFLRVPLEISYLLPVLLVAVPLWITFVRSRVLTAALFGLSLAYGAVSLEVLRLEYAPGVPSYSPDAITQAVGGRVSPHLKAGVLLADLRDRPAAQAFYLLRIRS